MPRFQLAEVPVIVTETVGERGGKKKRYYPPQKPKKASKTNGGQAAK